MRRPCSGAFLGLRRSEEYCEQDKHCGGAGGWHEPDLIPRVTVAHAEGIDDATWLHHLRRHDYSRWFRVGIHDTELAHEAEKIEKQPHANAKQSRKEIKQLIEKFYTLPAAAGEKS